MALVRHFLMALDHPTLTITLCPGPFFNRAVFLGLVTTLLCGQKILQVAVGIWCHEWNSITQFFLEISEAEFLQ